MTSQSTNSALLILGMHRSGTSALTGVLSLAGADPGPSLIPPAEGVNPKGFWEHREIVAIHERLLGALDTSWHDDRPLPEKWWLRPEILPFRNQLIDVIRRDFARSPTWVLKDPRLCRLIPLWLELLQQIDIKPRFIICLRHPLEVAASLERRDRVQPERACLLWLEHLVESEQWTRGHNRVLITFEQLLADWRATVGRISSGISLPLPMEKERAGEIDAFLEPSLRHHRHDESGLTEYGPISRLAIDAFHTANDGEAGQLTAHLAEAAKIIAKTQRDIAPWSAEISMFRRKCEAFQLQVAQLSTDNAILQAELARVKSTVSWQVTKPLRFLAFLWRKVSSGKRA